MLKKLLISVFVYAFVLTGCSTTGDSKSGDGAQVEDRTDAGAEGPSTTGLPGAGAFQGDPLDNPASPLSTRIIYFEYDSSEIKPEFQDIILAHGQYLAEHQEKSVTLEGHTDERGSREYNIGLGERRAQSVRRLLLFQGAADRQVQVVSYGEENPVAEGHDESSYSQNRRVEFIYKR
jgi:peptidoglycan-associated lipoprotein